MTQVEEAKIALTLNRPVAVKLTCAHRVNRMPALIHTGLGDIFTDRMAHHVCPTHALNAYIK